MKKLFSLALITVILTQCILIPVNAGSTEAPFEIYTLQEGEVSEYGYVDYKLVDSDGNEVVYEPSEATVTFSKDELVYATALPTAYDSRDNNCITAVKSQGSAGNCWAFAALSALESDSIIGGIDDIDTADYSEAHLVWFNKNSLINEADDTTSGDGFTTEDPYTGTNSGGNWQIATESLARWSGLAEETVYPFYPTDCTKMGNYPESSRYDTDSGVIIKSSEVLLNTDDIKQWIMEHGSVTASYYSDTSYYNTDTYGYYYSSETTANHMITIVGWDDDYARKNFKLFKRPSGAGAWLCKNSWGTGWGNNGYFWISYEDATLGNFVGFAAQKTDELYNNYSYNGAGWTGTLNMGTAPRIANVFESKSFETLSRISTYTTEADTDLTVSVYTDLPYDYTTPDEGTLKTTFTANIAREGYHTIELPAEIPLEPGTVFSVVIKLQTASGNDKVPVETDSGNYTYTCNEGESFLYNGGWKDVVAYSSLGIKNFCIQAFTTPTYTHESGIAIDLNDNIIITPDNNITYIKSRLEHFSNAQATVNGISGDGAKYCGTGDTLTFTQNGVTLGSYTVALAGDLNGDRVCDVLDVSLTERIANGHGTPTDLETYAANGCIADLVDVAAYQNVVNRALSS